MGKTSLLALLLIKHKQQQYSLPLNISTPTIGQDQQLLYKLSNDLRTKINIQVANINLLLIILQEILIPMPFTHKVFCQYCDNYLSDRGCSTVLRADRKFKIITTDYKTSKMIEIEQWRIFDKCACKVRDFLCAQCKNKIGYHVVEPCSGCAGNNNGHYYVFNEVRTEKTEVEWSNLSPIFKEKIHEAEQQWPQEFVCPICLDKMANPTIILCGHTFCNTCIQRHVDLKQNCPLDIKPMSREGPFIPNRAIQQLIAKEQEQRKKSMSNQ